MFCQTDIVTFGFSDLPVDHYKPLARQSVCLRLRANKPFLCPQYLGLCFQFLALDRAVVDEKVIVQMPITVVVNFQMRDDQNRKVAPKLTCQFFAEPMALFLRHSIGIFDGEALHVVLVLDRIESLAGVICSCEKLAILGKVVYRRIQRRGISRSRDLLPRFLILAKS